MKNVLLIRRLNRFILLVSSIVVSWFECPDRVISVDNEIGSIDIVTFQYHFENFGLMNSSFFHEFNNFILLGDGMVYVVVKLNLHLVFELTGLGQEIFIFWRISEILTVFGDKVEFADMGPRVVSVTHWVHGPNSNVLSTSKQVHLMNFLV